MCNMLRLFLKKSILCVVLFGITHFAWGLEFELGGGVSGSALRVKERDNPGGDVQAVMRKRSFSPYAALVGDDYFPFEGYNVGLSWQFWGTSYDINEQRVKEGSGHTYKDIGTHLSGVYFYALPIMYYRWGDKKEETESGYRISLGVGYGLSYMTMKGDIKITEAPNEPIETLNTQQLYYSAGFFFRADYKNYFFLINSFSPQLVHGDYSYLLGTVSWMGGYKFAIDFDVWGLL